MEGYLRLYRPLLEKEIWTKSTLEQRVILITLLMHARWSPKEWDVLGKKIIIYPGQFYTSTRRLAELSGDGITRQMVRTALDRFEQLGFLTQRPMARGTLITITNWTKYQRGEEETHQPSNSQNLTHRPTQQSTQSQSLNFTLDASIQDFEENRPTQQSTQHLTQSTPSTNPPINKEGIKKESNKGNKYTYQFRQKIEEVTGGHEALSSALYGFIEMREKRKKPLTPYAFSLAIKKLISLGQGDVNLMVELVNEATMNGWLSFYPLKKSKEQKGGVLDFYERLKRRTAESDFHDQSSMAKDDGGTGDFIF